MVGNPDYSAGKGVIVNDANSQHIVTEENPSCHLPHIHAGVDRDSNVETANAVANQNPGNGGSPPLCTCCRYVVDDRAIAL